MLVDASEGAMGHAILQTLEQAARVLQSSYLGRGTSLECAYDMETVLTLQMRC